MGDLKLNNKEVIDQLELPSEEVMADYLRKHGWSTWYNENYWVKRSQCENPNSDHTKAGLPMPAAYLCQIEGWPKFKDWIFGPKPYAPETSKLRNLKEVAAK